MHFRVIPLALVVLGLSVAALASSRQKASAGLEGTWEGAILVEEGRIEIEMAADFKRGADGQWTVRLGFPTMGVDGLEVLPTEIDAREFDLFFDPGDGSGEKQLAGELAADHRTIEGTFSQGTQRVPFYLERAAPAASSPVAVVELSPPGLEELRARFNRDRGNVRLLLLLSPT